MCSALYFVFRFYRFGVSFLPFQIDVHRNCAHWTNDFRHVLRWMQKYTASANKMEGAKEWQKESKKESEEREKERDV